ncbi:MAG TPA: penicillin-binding transpeptidase domain-containing protein [Acidimicrobiales bacterium]|nr:penicillin-binding transpeptidase domain-containing protein [Acidimicrobiales bacterium]
MSADRSKPLSERAIVATALVAALVAIAILLGLQSLADGSDSPLGEDLAEQIPPDAFVAGVAERWIEAWEVSDVGAMQELAVPPAEDLAERVSSFVDGLRVTALRASPRTPVVTEDRATVTLDVAVDLRGLGTWTFVTRLPLVLAPDAANPADWRVEWSRAVLHPELTGSNRLAVTRQFAPRAALLAADGSPLTGPLVGRVATAESDGEHRLLGDPVGVSGLHAAFDLELGGTASGEVQVVDAAGAPLRVLDRIEGRAPAPVQTSLDPRIQAIVDGQLSGLDKPAAMVVIRPSTGEVVAVGNNPPNGFNRALNGRYPPGSTFKIVTSTALLANGTTPDSPASCPEIATINGRDFRNAEGAALGDIPFRRAFFESCNTAFVQLAADLEAADLVAAAGRFGFNAAPGIELPAETSSFPEPHSIVDQASASIGQGRVAATPLQMATVAATVASGTHRSTTLRKVTSPEAGTPLPDGIAATLQELMRLVVEQGTGTAAQLPPPPVHGKTGTAEFGTDKPPRTHAWFVGFRGDLALAVVVEDSGFGGVVAAPIAREVFRQAG